MLLFNNVDFIFVDNLLSYIWNFDDLLINNVNVDDLLGIFDLFNWLFDDCFNFLCLGDWLIDCLPVSSFNNNWLVNCNINVLLADVNDCIGNIDLFNSSSVFNFLVELINDLLGNNNLVSCYWNFLDHIIDCDSGVCDVNVFISGVYNHIFLGGDHFSVDILDHWFDYGFDNWYINEPLGVDDFLDMLLNGVLNWGWNILNSDLRHFHDLVSVVDLNDWHFNFLGNFNDFDVFNTDFDWYFLFLYSVIVNWHFDFLLNFNNFHCAWLFNWNINSRFSDLNGFDNDFIINWNLVKFD